MAVIMGVCVKFVPMLCNSVLLTLVVQVLLGAVIYILESVITNNESFYYMLEIVKGFMKKFYVDITHKSQQRDSKTVEQATKVIISEDNLEYFLKVLDNMSDVTVENSIDGIADFKLSQRINTPNTVVYFFNGTAVNEILAKKSAKYVKKHHPNTTVKCFKGKFHCENALFNPEIMIVELDKIFDK